MNEYYSATDLARRMYQIIEEEEPFYGHGVVPPSGRKSHGRNLPGRASNVSWSKLFELAHYLPTGISRTMRKNVEIGYHIDRLTRKHPIAFGVTRGAATMSTPYLAPFALASHAAWLHYVAFRVATDDS